MPRSDYRENFNLIDWSKPLPELPRKAEIPVARSSLPCPRIMSDVMEPVQSMVDGSWHTSRSGLRATYKPSGNKDGIRYVEIGDDPARLKPRKRPPVDRKSVHETIQKAAARFKRGERVDRHKIAQA